MPAPVWASFVLNFSMMEFKDKKIVVAGGTSGIGLATAQRFQQQGAVVTVTGRDAEKLTASRIASQFPSALEVRLSKSSITPSSHPWTPRRLPVGWCQMVVQDQIFEKQDLLHRNRFE